MLTTAGDEMALKLAGVLVDTAVDCVVVSARDLMTDRPLHLTPSEEEPDDDGDNKR